MVISRLTPLWLLGSILLLPWLTWASADDLLSPEELRARAEQAEREAQQRTERVDTTKPAVGMKTDNPSEDAPAAVPQATDNFGASSSDSGEDSAANNRPSTPRRQTQRRSSGESSSVPDTGGGSGSVTLDVVSVKRYKYGIRIGTVLYGELRRNISSAESGWAEIVLTKDAVGDHRTLPAGTLLFANKSANAATRRMELYFAHGSTPAGDEFDLEAQAYDDQDVAGLSGIVEDKSKEIMRAGVNKGLLAAGKGALQSMTAGKGVIGSAAATGGGAVLSDVGTRQDATTDSGIIIYSYPQPVRIRVQKTF